MEVFDDCGVKVIEALADGRLSRLGLSTLPAGTYLLRIHLTDGTEARQIVKS